MNNLNLNPEEDDFAAILARKIHEKIRLQVPIKMTGILSTKFHIGAKTKYQHQPQLKQLLLPPLELLLQQLPSLLQTL